MPEGFVDLETLVRARATGPQAVPKREPVEAREEALEPAGEAPGLERFATELRFARLAALEAFERAVPRLLDELARDVLARELLLGGPELEALARCVLAEFASEEPVALVVSPGDAHRLNVGLPVRADSRLRSGDLIVEVRDGEIDARFTVRLHDAVASSIRA